MAVIGIETISIIGIKDREMVLGTQEEVIPFIKAALGVLITIPPGEAQGLAVKKQSLLGLVGNGQGQALVLKKDGMYWVAEMTILWPGSFPPIPDSPFS